MKGCDIADRKAATEIFQTEQHEVLWQPSPGDQCGRDTPDENILKLIEVARSYGKY